jgi:hypothetical protein
VLTAILHVLAPGQYGPITGGQIGIIMTEDWAVVALPKLIFALLYGSCLIRYWKAAPSLPNFLASASMGYLAYFTFNTGVHENHLFLVCLLLGVLAHYERAALPQFLLWAGIFNLNMLVFYGLDGRGLPFSRVVGGLDVTFPLAILSTVTFVSTFVQSIRVRQPGRINRDQAEPLPGATGQPRLRSHG